ncbi:MAG: adenosylhomocysteinase [Planctomycetes bacterium]|nr:adenosylhomocysteinase [Planctomycetota bacterium]
MPTKTAPKPAKTGTDSDVTDLGLAKQGRQKIEWAEKQMPVLRAIRARFEKEKALKGVRVAACLHVTSETANLMRTLLAGGAEVTLCASNPLSTQDDTAAGLVGEYGIRTYARRGEDKETYYRHIHQALDLKPHLTLDDGADLLSVLHTDRKDLLKGVWGGMEETTTGIQRLRAMAADGALKYPVLAVNDAQTKFLFDNRYGTGQSTVDGIIRATNFLFAGRTIVTAGYGWCGRGFANRARGLGARVVVTEVNSIKALEAAMDGFEVMPMRKAAALGDVFCTLTGDINVLAKEHFALLKDGAIIANSGHFNVEIDLTTLEKLAVEVKRQVRPNVDEFRMKDGRSIFVLAEGRLVNLAAAEGHPAAVMDMSFATQALGTEYMTKQQGKLSPKVHDVPVEVEDFVSRLKLESMGIEIDVLTPEQKKYITSWQEGT